MWHVYAITIGCQAEHQLGNFDKSVLIIRGRIKQSMAKYITHWVCGRYMAKRPKTLYYYIIISQ